MNNNAIRSGMLKPPQMMEIHCQLQTAPIHCAVKMPNVPAEKNIEIKIVNK